MTRGAALAAWLLTACGRVAFDPRAADDGGAAGTDDSAVPRACGTESSLVACYAFDGDLADSSGKANHATGSPLSYTNGHFGLSATLGASVDLRVADSPSLDAGHITVMGWVRLDVLPTTELRALVLDRNNGFALFVRNNGFAGFGISTTGTSGGANATTAFPIGVFTHIAATYDGTVPRLYTGGVEVATGGASGDITSADTAGCRIGGNLPDTTSTANQPWEGAVDQLGVWNEALPAARIAAAAAE